MGLNPRLIAVEYNGEILHRQYWENTLLKTGEKIEALLLLLEAVF